MAKSILTGDLQKMPTKRYKVRKELQQAGVYDDMEVIAKKNAGGGGGSSGGLAIESDPVWTADKPNYKTKTENDALYLKLNQTTPQTIASGVPLMTTAVDGEGSGNQLVNKDYVDLAVSSLELTEFFTSTASSLSPLGGITTYVMSPTSPSATSVTSAAVATGAAVNVFNFATIVGEPHLDRLMKNIYDCHVHCFRSVSATRTVTAYFQIYKITTGAVQTLLGTSETFICPNTATGGDPDQVHLEIATEVALDVTDRLIIKWWVTVTGTGGANPTFTLDLGGTKDSHFSLPINPLQLSNIFVPYTGAVNNVDLGAKNLTATNVMETTPTLLKLDQTTPQTLTAVLRTIILSGAGGVPRTTTGCGTSQIETATNKVNVKVLDFDTTTQEYAQWTAVMPDSYSGGTITAKFIWTHPATTTNFGVRWGLQARAFGDDDALDQAFGTAQEVTDTGGTTNDNYISPATSAITIGGTPAGGKTVVFQAYRDPANAADNMAVDAKLIAVLIEYPISQITD